jgi:hypothetical protein
MRQAGRKKKKKKGVEYYKFLLGCSPKREREREKKKAGNINSLFFGPSHFLLPHMYEPPALYPAVNVFRGRVCAEE